MKENELKELIPLVVDASLEAGKAIMKVYATTFEVESKDDKSPLTEADRKSHEIIKEALEKTSIPILSEEGRNIPYSERKDWDLLWIVDPLDGTKEFIKRNGEFTVNIALVENGKPILGVIYVPVLDIIYFSAKGEGAYKLISTLKLRAGVPQWDSLLDDCQRLPLPKKSNAFTVVGSRSHLNKETEEFIENLKIQHGKVEIASRGSSLKFCLVAEGQAQAYPRFAPTSEWDTAAGQAIVEESGGQVMLRDLSAPLIYNKENILNPEFIVLRKM